MMTPEDISIFAMMLNLDVEAGRAKLADRIRTEQAAAVAAERERCAKIAIARWGKNPIGRSPFDKHDFYYQEVYNKACEDVAQEIRENVT